jgi:hypothetical protein
LAQKGGGLVGALPALLTPIILEIISKIGSRKENE